MYTKFDHPWCRREEEAALNVGIKDAFITKNPSRGET
jgi:hypothetical protein